MMVPPRVTATGFTSAGKRLSSSSLLPLLTSVSLLIASTVIHPCIPVLLGYNTNGFAHHDPLIAIELLAEIGYQSVALTLDYGPLNPYDEAWPRHLAKVRDQLQRLGLCSTIETGARFLLDPQHKHQPTLVSPTAADRGRRIDFLRRAIDAAAFLGSDAVSLWSGTPTDAVDFDAGLDRLAAALEPVLAHAAARGVTLGFEPEPGMLIDTLDAFERLLARVDAPQLQLTLDVGHLWCQRELPLAEKIVRAGPRIVNVHIEDMRAGIHEHLMFGEGEMDFDAVLAALVAAGYTGPLHVELSRHSHLAPQAARQAYDFLRPRIDAARRGEPGAGGAGAAAAD